MKPSAGIRIGSALRPQGFGRLFTDNGGEICSCVWGAFLEAARPDAAQFAAYYINDMPNAQELQVYVDPGIDIRTPLSLEQKYQALELLREYVNYDVHITVFDGDSIMEAGIRLNDVFRVPRERVADLFASWGI